MIKVKVIRFAVGQIVGPLKVVEVGDNAKYGDVLKASGIPFDPKSMSLVYAYGGDNFFSKNADLGVSAEENETLGVFDNALLELPPVSIEDAKPATTETAKIDEAISAVPNKDDDNLGKADHEKI